MNKQTLTKDWKKQLNKFYGPMFECGDYEALEKFIESLLSKTISEQDKEEKLLMREIDNRNYNKGYDLGHKHGISETLDRAIEEIKKEYQINWLDVEGSDEEGNVKCFFENSIERIQQSRANILNLKEKR